MISLCAETAPDSLANQNMMLAQISQFSAAFVVSLQLMITAQIGGSRAR